MSNQALYVKSSKQYERNGELAIDEDILDAVMAADRIYIIAAGTSYHAV